MADLATLKSRIASEIHRSDLTSDIASAIEDAVLHYQEKPFAFNQTRATLNTVDGTEFYSDLTDVAVIDCITATVNGRKSTLEQWGFQEMEEVNTTTNSEGEPRAWSWYDGQIRLYPVPDQAYALTVSYTQRIDVPASDAASNAWTTEARDLIRHAAKMRLSRDVLMDPNAAAVCASAEQGAYRRLINESNALVSGNMRGNW